VTAVLDLRPVTGDPVVSGLLELHAVLDRLMAHGSSTGDFAMAVREVDRAVARLQAVRPALVAAADKASVAGASGMSGTGAWLSKQTRTTGAAAAGQVALAGALESLPVTGAALRDGEVSAEHAAVIADATRQLPASLDAEQRGLVDQRLVDQARTLDPAALREQARRALERVASREEADRHHDAVLRDEEARARAKTRLTLHDNHDGTLTGHFTVPTVAGAILKKVIGQLVSPRRGRLGATTAQAGTSGDNVDWAHRQGEAFAELLEHLPTDRLHTKTAATIVVTLDQTQLTADLAAAGVDTGHEISAGEARRLACGAGILPAVLNGASLPLDLGRTRRFFTEAQSVALATRHTTCIADGCDRPYAWTELHHRDPWSTMGRTDLANAEPLCGFHHHRIHDPAYHHRRHTDGTITFHRRT
jgi:hypothetical protein